MKTAQTKLAACTVPIAQRMLLSVFRGWRQLAERRLTAVFVGVLLLICGLLVFGAPHRIQRWALDTFLFLDGGWRVLNGQRPHLDFLTGLGPVTFEVVALGMLLTGSGPEAVDYGMAFAAAVLGVWAWMLFRTRMERPAAVLLAMFVMLTAASPHAIGGSPFTLTYASMYNRLGYALIILIVAEAARKGHRAAELWGGISSGCACALSFFLKPSYFLVAVALTGASFLFGDNRSRRRVAGLAIGFAAPVLAMLVYLRFDLAAIWHDLTTVVGTRVAKRSADVRIEIGWRAVIKHAREETALFLGIALLGLFVSCLPGRARQQRYSWWPLAAAVAVFAVDLAFISTNGVQFAMPLTAAFALLLLSEIYAWWEPATAGERQAYELWCSAALPLAFVLFVPQAATDLATMGYSFAQPRTGPPVTARFQAPNLQRLLTLETPRDWDEPENGKALVDRVNEGTALLQRASSPTESVVVLDYVNPFSYGLRRKPAPGGGPYLGGLFTAKTMPSGEWMFGRTDLVIVPKNRRDNSAASELYAQYGSFIETRFKLAGESPSWRLYRRSATVHR